MICVWQQERGHLPAGQRQADELVDMFDLLLDVGHSVEETCDFLVAYAAGEVA